MADGPLCIVTFLTRTGRCCYYAERTVVMEDGEFAPPRLPSQISTQLDALGARVGWMYLGPPRDLRVKGEAFGECSPVTTATPEQLGRLVLC